jgi:hypothetical protein
MCKSKMIIVLAACLIIAFVGCEKKADTPQQEPAANTVDISAVRAAKKHLQRHRKSISKNCRSLSKQTLFQGLSLNERNTEQTGQAKQRIAGRRVGFLPE